MYVTVVPPPETCTEPCAAPLAAVTTSGATVSVTLRAVDDLPAAAYDRATVRTLRAVEVPVVSNDVDPDGGSLSVSQVSDPAHGTATITGGGRTVTYRSDAGWVGPDEFTYTARDAAGGTSTATVFVNVTSATANTAPVAIVDAAQVPGSATTVRIEVLTNDSDADGDALTIAGVSAPPNGTAVITGRTILYTIRNARAGRDTFLYTIRDGFGGVSWAVVTVTWAPLAPEADFRMTSIYSSMLTTRTAQGAPVALYNSIIVGWEVRPGVTSATPVTLEFQLPPGVYSVGTSDKPTRGLDLVPHDHCSIVYSGATPARYRCTVTQQVGARQGFQTFAYAIPTSTASFDFTATVTSALRDPTPGDNVLTLRNPADCVPLTGAVVGLSCGVRR